MTPDIGRTGVWINPQAWQGTDLTGVAVELEDLGYGAFWLGGSPTADLVQVEELLAATRTMVVGTSIFNVWTAEPDEVAESYRRVVAIYPERFILGIGAGHRQINQQYTRPYERLVQYLDELDRHIVPAGRRMLAALGPRVLELSRDRTAGALPYLATPEHTRRAREILGSGRLLVPEQKVVLETDPEAARAIARQRLAQYLQLSNYTSNWRRLGFTEDDLAGGGSEALVDAMVVWGDEERIRARLAEHYDAGADHVAIQVLGGDRLAAYRTLAQVLSEVRR